MAEKPPVLDSRNLEYIMNQLKQRAEEIYGEDSITDNDTDRKDSTDSIDSIDNAKVHWVSDPAQNAGAMLHMIFARFMELAAQRLNQVPEKAFIAFLDAMGISILPPTPARVPITFVPAKEAPPVSVPKGTKVALKDSAEPIIFETEENLTVIPGEIAKLYTIDPLRKRFSDISSRFTEESTLFHPLVGKKNMPKVMHIGLGKLLNMNKGEIIISLIGAGEKDITELYPAEYEYISEKERITLNQNNKNYHIENGVMSLKLAIEQPIKESCIQGVSLEPRITKGVQGYWLTAKMYEYSREIAFSQLKVRIQQKDYIYPDAAAVNSNIIELGENPLLPFGPIPKQGDMFYLAFREAFSKTGCGDFEAKIEFIIDMEGSIKDKTKLKLLWEYFSGPGGWKIIQAVADVAEYQKKGNCILDSTGCFLSAGTHTINMKLNKDTSIQPVQIGTEMNYWIRVSIEAGSYGFDYQLEPIDAKDTTKGYKIMKGDLTPPFIKKIGMKEYTVTAIPEVICQRGWYYYSFNNTNRSQSKAPGNTSGEAPGNTSGAVYPFSNQFIPKQYFDVEPAFYIGFDRVYRELPITLYTVNKSRQFTNRTVKSLSQEDEQVKLCWEYYNGTIWKNLMVIDGTNSFTCTGTIKFLMPYDIQAISKIDLQKRFYIRARAESGDPLKQGEEIKAIYLNTIPAEQSVTTLEEKIGSSNGKPHQSFHLINTPILYGQQLYVKESEIPTEKEITELTISEGTSPIEHLKNRVTEEEEIWVRWHEVANFYGSESYSRHYTLNHETGELTFGDGRKGLIPPKGINNLKVSYKTSKGSQGNAGKGTITKLISSVPSIDKAYNPEASDGGADGETMNMVKIRGPKALKNRNRAIACDDFEWMIREAAGPRVQRIKCLPNRNSRLEVENGCVTIVVIPSGNDKKLIPGPELIKKLNEYLKERVYTGLLLEGRSKVNIIGPGYIKVEIEVEVVPQDIDQAQEVKNNVLDALNRFFHPLIGGTVGNGWEFGRDVYASEVYRLLEGVPGVDHVRYESMRIHSNAVQKEATVYIENLKSGGLSEAESLYIPEGSKVHYRNASIVDVPKCSVLAEPFYMRPGTNRIRLKGLKEGDKVRLLYSSIDYPFTITVTSISYDIEGHIVAGVEALDYEINYSDPYMVISTWDNTIQYKILDIRKNGEAVIAFVLDDVMSKDKIEKITLPNGQELLMTAYVDAMSILETTAYVDENYIVYSGMHHISIVTD